jgi:hypothetical protein
MRYAALFLQPDGWHRWLKAIVLTVGAFLLSLSYFFLQFFWTDPAVSVRWGLFPIDRLSPPFFLSREYLTHLVGLSLVVGIWSWLPHRMDKRWSKDVQSLLGIVVLFIAFSPLALPLSGIILGKSIQPYHFDERGWRLISLGYYCTLIAIGVLVFYILNNIRMIFSPRIMSAARICGVIVLLLCGVLGSLAKAVSHAVVTAKVERQQRVRLNWPPEQRGAWGDMPTYRHDFNALVQELSKANYAGARVLGTFDQQLGMWWLALHKGFLYIPDTFISTTSDEEILRRTISFMQLVGGTPDFFNEKIGELYFQVRFLSLAKWQAFAGYTAAPISEYQPEQISRIQKKSVMNTWDIELPKSERIRLEKAFLQITPLQGGLDIIILDHGQDFGSLPGPQQGFMLTYENPTFRVWVRNQKS